MPQEWQGWVKVDWRPHLGTWRAGDPLKLPASPSSLPILLLSGKIEIKIVRPGAEGKEEDTRWLTDEDTRNLKEIFFNILVRHPTHIAHGCQPVASRRLPALSIVVEPHSPIRGEAKPQLLLGRIRREAISLVPASCLGLRAPPPPRSHAQDFLGSTPLSS